MRRKQYKKHKKVNLMDQYDLARKQNPGALVLCRVGDFYEAFKEDAETISQVLGITLTARDKDKLGQAIAMAGIPHHSLDAHLYKLVNAGHKVAIVEQMEDAKLAKGIVKRDVVRVVTPGTVIDPKALDHKSNNYLISVFNTKNIYGLAFVDVSTGEFVLSELDNISKLWAEIARLAPRESLFSEDFAQEEILENVEHQLKAVINYLPDWRFDPDSARSELLKQFNVLSLEGFGCEHFKPAIGAAGALIYYLNETQKQEVAHIRSMSKYTVSDFVLLDADTQRNLELTRSLRDGSKKGTLLDLIDHTMTSMGGRKLKRWLLQPLRSADRISERLDAVEELHDKIGLQEELRGLLGKMGDMERLTSRISLGTANAREVTALSNSLKLIPELMLQLESCTTQKLRKLYEKLDPMTHLTELFDRAIHPSPPNTIREGGIIADGFSDELDELRKISRSGKDWISSLEKKERKRTGISSLKIGFNQVFGYYIDVTKTNLKLVPSHYIRKQTLTNSERFITPELKDRETQILNAEGLIHDLEYRLFCEIREKIAKETARIQGNADAVATLDLMANLAFVASNYNYGRPIIDESSSLSIKDGRHPVVEQLVMREGFVPNDLELNDSDRQMYVITGPNMSGKSTFMRQTALIVLMAQMGSFIPASSATIGIVDQVFTRVGASDNLAMGQSTFLVEMNETANILNNATDRSLIILDEIGRGTSTFDGISIAWSVAEHILDRGKIGARTLFATHYHEMTELATKNDRVKNYNVAVHEDGETVTFLRKIVAGGTDQSYGIHVAQLAGLPQTVIKRAYQVLKVLEQQDLSIDKEKPSEADEKTGNVPRKRRKISRSKFRDDSLQMALFQPQVDPVVDKLRALELNNLSPMAALNILYELKAEASR